LFLIKREVVIGNAEGEDGHGGGVGGAGGLFVGGAMGPRAVGALMLEGRVAERRLDAVPIFAAQLVGGLGTVVNAVVIKFVAGAGDVGIGAVGLIAPPAGMRALGNFLRIEDQLGGLGDRGFELGFAGIVNHAEGFAEHDGADAVVVHRAAVGGEQAIGHLVAD